MPGGGGLGQGEGSAWIKVEADVLACHTHNLYSMDLNGRVREKNAEI